MTVFQESDAQEDDAYDDPQEAEVIQSLLDVVDEEAQNLLNHSNAAGDASAPGSEAEWAPGYSQGGWESAAEQFHSSRPVSFPGALKTNEKLAEESAEDTDGDGSPLPEDFMEVRLIPT